MSAVAELEMQFVEQYDVAAPRREGEPAWLLKRRAEGLAEYKRLGVPSAKHEDWKYTSLAALSSTPYVDAASLGANDSLTLDAVYAAGAPRLDGPRLVFVDGYYAAKLSDISKLPEGAHALPISRVVREMPEVLSERFEQTVPLQNKALRALNEALFSEGAVLFFTPHVMLDAPIHLIFVASDTAEPQSFQYRNVITASEGSSLRVVETYVGIGDSVHFSNALTDIFLGGNSGLQHSTIVAENRASLHVNHVLARQERASKLTKSSFAVSGAQLRQNIDVELIGKGAELSLAGLCYSSGKESQDTRVLVRHLADHCQSRQLYKHIADGASTVSFAGRVSIGKDVKQSEAHQQNKNLLLSTSATANSKPQLEIYNDDVVASHGSATGALDEDSLFYLLSRGFDKDAARELLLQAFLGELIEAEPESELRDALRAYYAKVAAHD